MNAKKSLLIATIAIASVSAPAQDAPTPYYNYRVQLADKAGTEYSIHHPEQFLSERSLSRRQRQGIRIDQTDLPVSATYLQQLREAGAEVILTSKWQNTVLVGTSDTLLAERIASMPFVTAVRKVSAYEKKQKRNNKNGIDRTYEVAKVAPNLTGSSYRNALTQIAQLNGIAMHGAGFRGEGMVMAIIDSGFFNVDVIPSFANTKILGYKDFVDPDADIFAESSHGTLVLSCIGANNPGWYIGTAPEASFWLIRSEDFYSEQLVEEDNWCAAVEFADSVGADVINSSLGYIKFDNTADNLTHEELNGASHINSRQASMIASKGMILCNSAGNEGRGEWVKIGTPADATDILAVGAITASMEIAPFSSRGYSVDGRIKPDVVAMGERAAVINALGYLSYADGTSFASPILSGMVTCLWQALPWMDAYEIMDLVRRSGDRYQTPDETFGYGLPDFFHAYTMGLMQKYTK